MDDHSRTIIHIDIDCFYAQVEMVKQPSLRHKPFAVQQKHIVVTSNYIAREYGIKKCMTITEAKRLCPTLILVNGEDLYEYRQVSNKVSELLRDYSELVERLALDENFIDVTDLVKEKLQQVNGDKEQSVGCLFGNSDTIVCDCGCKERIIIGSEIAQNIRNQIFEKLQLTTCAGIAHNKLLAKIVGAKNRPNNQTFLFPNCASELMLSLGHVENIPGVGHTSAELLNKLNITTIEELQNCDSTQLETSFNSEKAKTILNLSYGIDNAPVKKSGKPQSIGIEDACKPLITEAGVRDKFKELFARLLILIKEDGRIPRVLKVTVRRSSESQPTGNPRETRQCNISTSVDNESQIIDVAMILFRKVVGKAKVFRITLLGLSFSKFVDKPNDKNTLTSFLSRNKSNSLQNKYHRLPTVEDSAELMANEETESSLEPAVKKARLSATYVEESATTSCENMRNNLKRLEVGGIECPPGVDKGVFQELPLEVQLEVWNDYKSRDRDKNIQIQKPSSKKTKHNSIFNYMIRQ